MSFNFNACIQNSRGQEYQNLAIADFEKNTPLTLKSFCTRRLNGVVKKPLSRIRDVFDNVMNALNEVKHAFRATEREMKIAHLHNAACYIALAVLFAGDALISPVINAVNPNIFNAVSDAAKKTHTEAMDQAEKASKDAIDALGAKIAGLEASLKEKEIANAALTADKTEQKSTVDQLTADKAQQQSTIDQLRADSVKLTDQLAKTTFEHPPVAINQMLAKKPLLSENGGYTKLVGSNPESPHKDPLKVRKPLTERLLGQKLPL